MVTAPSPAARAAGAPGPARAAAPRARLPLLLRTASAGFAALALAAGAGCAAIGGDRSGIVVTTDILGDVVRSVVGDEAEVTVLMKPGSNPHSFGVAAQQAAALEQAELVVYNGLGLEEGVLRHVEAAGESGTPLLEVAAEVDPLPYTGGEDEGAPDPHFWTDPVRVQSAAEVVAGAVAEQVGGVDADSVAAAAEDYSAQVAEVHGEAEEQFAALPEERRKLVTDHHVFGYFAQRYGFEVLGAVIPGGTTLASPSGADLESLSSAVREAGVPAVFADSARPDRLSQVMAEEAGVEVEVVPLFTESLSGPGGEAATYPEMFRSNAEAIAGALAAE
ncbi:zinc ABC transporter substrate-binding protein AztC [Nocardiopsis coralliicola]